MKRVAQSSFYWLGTCPCAVLSGSSSCRCWCIVHWFLLIVFLACVPNGCAVSLETIDWGKHRLGLMHYKPLSAEFVVVFQSRFALIAACQIGLTSQGFDSSLGLFAFMLGPLEQPSSLPPTLEQKCARICPSKPGLLTGFLTMSSRYMRSIHAAVKVLTRRLLLSGFSLHGDS